MNVQNLQVEKRKRATSRREVVVPFARLAEMPAALSTAQEMARQSAAEIVIRRVSLPTSVQRCAVDHEQLYSELKALQAQTQAMGVSARIEACYCTGNQAT